MMDGKKFGNAVRKHMDDNGIKYAYVADKLGMSRQLFNTRLLGNGWTLDEVMRTIKILGLPKDILTK